MSASEKLPGACGAPIEMSRRPKFRGDQGHFHAPDLGLRTRRWFLTVVGGSIVAVACSSDGSEGKTSTTQEDLSDTRTPGTLDLGSENPIVVVGAGIAGLTAARALHDAGYEVVVVEGRDRIGGRTFTTEVGPATVDLGGAWIHGPIDNPIAEFADGRSLTYEFQSLDFDLFHDGVAGGRSGFGSFLEPFLLAEGFPGVADDILEELGSDASLADGFDVYMKGEDGETARRTRFALEILTGGYAGSYRLTRLSMARRRISREATTSFTAAFARSSKSWPQGSTFEPPPRSPTSITPPKRRCSPPMAAKSTRPG